MYDFKSNNNPAQGPTRRAKRAKRPNSLPKNTRVRYNKKLPSRASASRKIEAALSEIHD